MENYFSSNYFYINYNIVLFFVFWTLRYLKKDKKKKFFHFMDNINEFKQYIHEKDLDLFIIILKENFKKLNKKVVTR